MMSKFATSEEFIPESADWQLLPFHFERTNGKGLVTNMVGEHLFVSADEFDELAHRRLPADSSLVRKLRAKQIIRQQEDQAPRRHLAQRRGG